MNATAAPSPTSLLFSWEPPRRRKAAIIGFLAASLILHAFCFYVFQIVYPPTVVLLPPPARLSLISSNTEAGRTLLRWIEAEDPALASATHRPAGGRLHALPKVRHIPSYLTKEPRLKEVPPPVFNSPAVSSQPPGPVPITHQQIKPANGLVPTAVRFSKELDELGAAKFPTSRFTASTPDTPQSIQFHIGASGRGEIRYCFPLNSSGDPALDEQARRHLVLCRFAGRSTTDERGEQSLVWGIATLEWGNDVTLPQPTSTTEAAGAQGPGREREGVKARDAHQPGAAP